MPESQAAATPDDTAIAFDQRVLPRVRCATVTLTRLSLVDAERTYFAWVHDISEEGIGLDVLAPLSPGVDVVFELKRGANAKVRLHAQVVHATPAGPFYRLGCKFTRPLRPRVLHGIMQQIRSA